MHHEERLLLNAVIDDPTNDLPRQIIADWYEDHNQPERAEFIRLQCHLAKHGISTVVQNPVGEILSDGTRVDELKKRERELFLLWPATGSFSSDGQNSLGGPRDKTWPKTSWSTKTNDLCYISAHDSGLEKVFFRVTWRRGFVKSLLLTGEMCLQHMDDLIQYNPLKEVGITNYLLYQNTSKQFYFELKRHEGNPGVHCYLFERLAKKGLGKKWHGERNMRVYYPNQKVALQDMTNACLQYGIDKLKGKVSYPESYQW